ncbi:RimK/LysX family protein [Malonomonas rubra]|uniref:putative ATP-dependent zinc protease n=1 Tax=Malonomonas rubra TaxID=57040 RepID=UPI0026EB0C73|nr:RimK/LysX family protein [Malonomonas rubra]
MADFQHMVVSGWREWLSLPEFNVQKIEAKVDTGTKTSVLHTSFIEPLRKQGTELWLRFGIHPLPGCSDVRMIGFAPVKERRLVKDAEGHSEVCFVVAAKICLGEHC